MLKIVATMGLSCSQNFDDNFVRFSILYYEKQKWKTVFEFVSNPQNQFLIQMRRTTLFLRFVDFRRDLDWADKTMLRKSRFVWMGGSML